MAQSMDLQSHLQDHLSKLEAMEYDFKNPMAEEKEEIVVEEEYHSGSYTVEESIDTLDSYIEYGQEETFEVNVTDPIQIEDIEVIDAQENFLPLYEHEQILQEVMVPQQPPMMQEIIEHFIPN